MVPSALERHDVVAHLRAATSILGETNLLGARKEACMCRMKSKRTTTDNVIESIARLHLELETLDTRRADSLDFRELGVWQLRDALEAAYRAGATCAIRTKGESRSPQARAPSST